MAAHQLVPDAQALSYQSRAPRAELRCAIARLWQLESRSPVAWSPGRWALPDGRAEWLFVLGDPMVRDGQCLLPGAYAGGLAMRARQSRAAGRVLLLGVVFEPGSAAAALPVPACAIAGCAAPLSASWGGSAEHLVARLRELSCFRERAALLEEEIAARLRPPDPEVSAAVARLLENPALRIDRLAGNAAAVRRLQRKFLERVGVSPKQLARVFRLQKAMHCWATGAVAGWAQLAAAADYADQAHLSREFTALTGVSPHRLAQGARGMSHSFKTPARDRGTMPR